MAKTQFIDVPDELKNLEQKALERRDRFILGVVQGHKREPSKAQKRLLRRPSVVNSPQEGRGSLFRFLSPLWRNLTTEQKGVWADAAAFSSLTNWQLFISDNAARIRNSLTLEVPPSELWQVRTGRLVIQSPASEIILKQEHPLDYVVSQKIPGRPWKYELVSITEIFSLPLQLQIRYKSDLTAVGGGSDYTPPAGDSADFSLSEYTPPTSSFDFEFAVGSPVARFYARVWTSYQGVDTYTDIEIPFSASTDWTFQTVSLTSKRGILIGYTLFIEISGYHGELLFDNIGAVHGGTNWARDPRCDEINKQFQKAFAVVPPFWIPVSLPVGSSFSSVFPPSLS